MLSLQRSRFIDKHWSNHALRHGFRLDRGHHRWCHRPLVGKGPHRVLSGHHRRRPELDEPHQEDLVRRPDRLGRVPLGGTDGRRRLRHAVGTGSQFQFLNLIFTPLASGDEQPE